MYLCNQKWQYWCCSLRMFVTSDVKDITAQSVLNVIKYSSQKQNKYQSLSEAGNEKRNRTYIEAQGRDKPYILASFRTWHSFRTMMLERKKGNPTPDRQRYKWENNNKWTNSSQSVQPGQGRVLIPWSTFIVERVYGWLRSYFNSVQHLTWFESYTFVQIF